MCYPDLLFDYCLFIVIIVTVLFGFSVIAEVELLQAHVLQASVSAVLYRPRRAAPPSPPTRRTSGTRATPAATLPPTLRPAPSLSEKSPQTSVS